MLAVDDQRHLAPVVIVAHGADANRAVVMVGRRQEDECARPAGLRRGAIVTRDVEHHGDARRVVHRAFEEGVGVSHDEDLLVARARQHTPDIGRLEALALFGVELEMKHDVDIGIEPVAYQVGVVGGDGEGRRASPDRALGLGLGVAGESHLGHDDRGTGVVGTLDRAAPIGGVIAPSRRRD
jgi:hypothetical protein